MPIDIGAVAGMVSSIKAAADITRAMVGLRDAAMIQGKVIELNSVILSAQASAFEANNTQSELLNNIGKLEKEIADLEAWETEKKKYDLREVTPHSYAYAIRDDERGSKPAHFICATCYEHRKKIILQKADAVHLSCPECKTRVTFKDTNFNRPMTRPQSPGWS